MHTHIYTYIYICMHVCMGKFSVNLSVLQCPPPFLTPVGFEPTQLALVGLESTPLDHSGKVSTATNVTTKKHGTAHGRSYLSMLQL